MIKLPNRDDEIYSEIENFEDYELTNCIAYEMAIRNDEVKLKLYSEINYSKELREIYLIDSYATIFYHEFIRKLNFNENKILKEIAYLLENKNCERGLYRGIINDYKTYLKEGIGCLNIYLKQKRPLLHLPKENNIKIPPLNFNLNEEELCNYIKKVKKEYDKTKSNIKTPLELLLGENHERASDNPLLNKKTKKISKTIVSDMFFIYDGVKEGMKQSEIIASINYYHYDKKTKTSNFDSKTYNKYLKISIDLIDNLKYKELITGIKD